MDAMSDKNNFADALDYINTFQFHGFRLGLERMEAVLEAVGHPEQYCPCIHVAGTNGKGSVCAILTAVLNEAGYKAGLYTSPHLYSLRERFRVGDQLISEEDLTRLIFQIRDLVEAGFELSYFEFTTLLAMLWFREQRVDIAIYETGLGGRLDATNVIVPEVSVITNISFDHKSYLGNTLEEIAWEKAGIIKSGVPVISGEYREPAATVIRKRAASMKAPLLELGRDIRYYPSKAFNHFDYAGNTFVFESMEAPLLGEHQVRNSALSLGVLELIRERGFNLDEEIIRKGFKAVTWPGRGEMLVGPCKVILDGAHNPEGVAALKMVLSSMVDSSNECPSFRCLLWACSDEGGDKPFFAMLKEISSFFDHVIITEPPGPRVPVGIDRWKGVSDSENILIKDWRVALEKAISLCKEKEDCLCVAGSLYLIGAVRKELLQSGFS